MAGLLNAQRVGDLYNQYLGRAPEAGKVDEWMEASKNQGRNIENEIANSPEAKARGRNTGIVPPHITAPTIQQTTPIERINTPAPAAVGSTGYTATNANVVNATGSGYQSQATNVNPESTSAYQLAQITGSDSLLNTQARTYADQTSNRRGLLNSSMAVNAAHDAVLRNATPLAINDANTYANANTATSAAENASRQFGAQAGNTASLQNSQLGTSVNVTNAGAANEAGKFTAGASNTAAIESARNTLQTKLADIQANTSLTIAQKEIESRRAIAQAQLEMTASTSNAENGVRMQLAQIQANTQLSVTDKNNATNIAISNGDNATKQLLGNLDASTRLAQTQLDADTKIKIASLDAATKASLGKIENDNRQLLQANVNAANMYQQYATNLANISLNDKLDFAAKQTAMTNQTNVFNAGLQAIGEVSNLNLSKYFQSAAPVSTAPQAPQASLMANNNGGLLNAKDSNMY